MREIKHTPFGIQSYKDDKNKEQWLLTNSKIDVAHILSFNGKDMAEFIKHRVNSHEALKAKADLLDELLDVD